ncbi:MAG TPA: PP2C family protein-serine/threonine phosphatase [Solirubrobacteraceae bacterium]|nr:PP2C family protein-serine/threonine phosphatase [Solirubrobacteraceae bacterium]
MSSAPNNGSGGPRASAGRVNAQGCCVTSPAPAPVAAPNKHRERTASPRPAATGNGAPAQARGETSSGSGSGQAPVASGRRHGAEGVTSGRPKRRGRGRPGEGQHGGAPVESAGESEAAGAEAQVGAAPFARKREVPKGKHRKAKETRHPRVPGPPHQERPAVTALAAAVSSAPTVSAPVAAAAKPPAASTPSLIGGRRQSASAGVADSRSRRAARRPGARPAAALIARSLAPAAVLATAPTATQSAASTHKPASRAPSQTAPAQLVTTVTRIINVIPAAVQIAIGALIALALALAISSRLASMRARRLARQRQQLLEDVGLLQAALLPPAPARLGPVGTSSAYRPASGPGAGGDFYDVFALGDGQVAVIVGDVSGHGRDALPQTTLVRFTLRAYLEAGMSPRSALQMAAPVLERQLGDSFATVVLATYNPRERILVYACAGHPAPMVIGTETIAPVTACSAPPIGAGQPTGTRQTVVSLPGESLVCFYTDGVVDARTRGELFGARRLKAALAGLGAGASASALLDRVAEETDQRPDDMAACLLRIEGDGSAASVQAEEVELDRGEVARDRVERLLLARGFEMQEIEQIMASARRAVAREGAVVLELHLGDQRPEVALRPQNVALFEPTIRASSRALEMSG